MALHAKLESISFSILRGSGTLHAMLLVDLDNLNDTTLLFDGSESIPAISLFYYQSMSFPGVSGLSKPAIKIEVSGVWYYAEWESLGAPLRFYEEGNDFDLVLTKTPADDILWAFEMRRIINDNLEVEIAEEVNPVVGAMNAKIIQTIDDTWRSADARIGNNGIEFDNPFGFTGSYAQSPAYLGDEEFTISFWIQMNRDSYLGNVVGCEGRQGLMQDIEWRIQATRIDTYQSLEFRVDGASSSTSVFGYIGDSRTAYQLVVATYSDRVLRLYTSNDSSEMVLRGSAVMTEDRKIIGPSSDFQVSIAAAWFGANPWSGRLDELIAWGRALRASEIQDLYNGAATYEVFLRDIIAIPSSSRTPITAKNSDITFYKQPLTTNLDSSSVSFGHSSPDPHGFFIASSHASLCNTNIQHVNPDQLTGSRINLHSGLILIRQDERSRIGSGLLFIQLSDNAPRLQVADRIQLYRSELTSRFRRVGVTETADNEPRYIRVASAIDRRKTKDFKFFPRESAILLSTMRVKLVSQTIEGLLIFSDTDLAPGDFEYLNKRIWLEIHNLDSMEILEALPDEFDFVIDYSNDKEPAFIGL